MKRIVLILAILAALLLSGCSLPFGGSPAQPEATFTPLPTYTPFPTWTPPPSPTATFLPAPTEAPTLEAATPTADGAAGLPTPTTIAAQPGTGASGATTALLAFGSYMRSGPGESYDVLMTVPAGTVVTVDGRDYNGFWMLVTTPRGNRGWIKTTQFQGLTNVAAIPQVTEEVITVTPGILGAVSPTPRASTTPGTAQPTSSTPRPTTTGTPPTATIAPVATGVPTPGTYGPNDVAVFIMVAGGSRVCNNLFGSVDRVMSVPSGQVWVPFNSLTPNTVPSAKAFRLQTVGVPAFIAVTIDGNVKPANCQDTACVEISFKLCGQAQANSPTGGNQYPATLVLEVGTQSYNTFADEGTDYYIETAWQVNAP